MVGYPICFDKINWKQGYVINGDQLHLCNDITYPNITQKNLSLIIEEHLYLVYILISSASC